MQDVTKSPYAEWLEGFIKAVLEEKPEKIGVCAIMPDGNAMTGYYGECCHQDKAMMGYHMNLDAVADVTMANAKLIMEAAEEQDGDEP